MQYRKVANKLSTDNKKESDGRAITMCMVRDKSNIAMITKPK